MEYARALVDNQEPYPKAIAILQLSTLYGFSDPKYIATLGGMLFMNGDFTEAFKVFSESIKREFPALEAKRIQFRPCNPEEPKKPYRLSGRVVSVKAGFAFIQSIGYPEFFVQAPNLADLL